MRGWWLGQGQLCLRAGSAWCWAGASGMGVSSLGGQPCLGEAWECLPKSRAFSPFAEWAWQSTLLELHWLSPS